MARGKMSLSHDVVDRGANYPRCKRGTESKAEVRGCCETSASNASRQVEDRWEHKAPANSAANEPAVGPVRKESDSEEYQQGSTTISNCMLSQTNAGHVIGHAISREHVRRMFECSGCRTKPADQKRA